MVVKLKVSKSMVVNSMLAGCFLACGAFSISSPPIQVPTLTVQASQVTPSFFAQDVGHIVSVQPYIQLTALSEKSSSIVPEIGPTKQQVIGPLTKPITVSASSVSSLPPSAVIAVAVSSTTQSSSQSQPKVVPAILPPVLPPVTVAIVTPKATINPIAGKVLFTASSSYQNAPQITTMPSAVWVGDWYSTPSAAISPIIAVAEKTTPVFVAYNIPGRDCGSYSAGGADSNANYIQWITSFAQSIGSHSAIVILEPDALAQLDCLDEAGRDARLFLISQAVHILKTKSAATVYIDAGHSRWHSTTIMAERLKRANISESDGFSLNVSSFIATSEIADFGTKLSKLVDNTHFIIDTSRNGNGASPTNEWCNPRGRALGVNPTTETTNSLIDAFLWIKHPGESDGNCNGAPTAGIWWPEYAAELIANRFNQ